MLAALDPAAARERRWKLVPPVLQLETNTAPKVGLRPPPAPGPFTPVRRAGDEPLLVMPVPRPRPIPPPVPPAPPQPLTDRFAATPTPDEPDTAGLVAAGAAPGDMLADNAAARSRVLSDAEIDALLRTQNQPRP